LYLPNFTIGWKSNSADGSNITFSSTAVYINEIQNNEVKKMIIPKLDKIDNKLLQFSLVRTPKESCIDASLSCATIMLEVPFWNTLMDYLVLPVKQFFASINNPDNGPEVEDSKLNCTMSCPRLCVLLPALEEERGGEMRTKSVVNIQVDLILKYKSCKDNTFLSTNFSRVYITNDEYWKWRV